MITSEKIAQLCEVTRATVDRALNNRSGISQKTKEKILKVASELGYTPNYIARSLSKGVTFTIGVVVLDLYNQFFSHLLNCLEAEAIKHGYYIQIALSHKDISNENLALEHFINRKVDGIILYSVHHNSEMFLKVNKAGIPMVSIINRIKQECSYIGINDKSAIFGVIKYLSEVGHKKIGYISYPLDSTGILNQYALIERFHGFKEALEKFNLPYDERYVIVNSGLNEGLKKLLEDNISGNQSLPSAFVCIDDLYAIETINFLKKYNLNVPKDISIVGFDNIQASDLVTPPLTTIEYPVEIIAQKAINYIIDAAASQNNSKDKCNTEVNVNDLIDETLPTKMILRQSVKNLI